jgi:phosphoglycerate dehydrogenase-like enzyme
VRYFARPFLKRGIRIFSAADANAVPVIEFTLAQIILANKGYFRAVNACRSSWAKGKEIFSSYPGNFDTSAGIIGAGKIGRGLILKLRDLRIGINVFDPYLNAAGAEQLGVTKTETLEELFAASFVISNHLADNGQTRGMIQYRHFSLMHENGVFINTARGAQVVEEDLVRALTEKPGRIALLDVTWPEPPPENHPFYRMDNVYMSPHIAGSEGNETARMGEYMSEEFQRFAAGEPLRWEVTEAMLAAMA